MTELVTELTIEGKVVEKSNQSPFLGCEIYTYKVRNPVIITITT